MSGATPARAQALGKERALLEKTVGAIESLSQGMDDAELLLELAKQENDAEAAQEAIADLDKFTAQVEELEFRRMFPGEMDPNNAFLDIQSVPAAPRPRTGPKCCCACTCAGANSAASLPS